MLQLIIKYLFTSTEVTILCLKAACYGRRDTWKVNFSSPFLCKLSFFYLLFVYLFYSALPGFDEIVSPSARSSGPDRVRLSSYLTLFFSLNLCWWLLMSCLTCNYRPLTQRSISFKTVIVTMLKVVKSKKMNLIYMIFLKNHLILKSHMILLLN